MSYLHHVPRPVPWLDHVHPSSPQTESRATSSSQTASRVPPVPWLYHVLPSSSQTISRHRVLPKNVSSPFGDAWRVKLSLFSPFVTFIDITLSTDFSVYIYWLLSLFVINSIL